MRLAVFVAVAAIVLPGCGEAPAEPDAAGLDANVECGRDSDCDDGRFCNGVERCAAEDPAADERGCAPAPPPCGTGICDESANACRASCEAGPPDGDGDGVDAIACGGTDCADDDGERFPGNSETCDDHDEDCDPTSIGERDDDGDGRTSSECCNGALCGDDCDDSSPSTYPGATEVCNDEDDDCDRATDEGLPVQTYARDCDGDGFGEIGGSALIRCSAPAVPPDCTGGAWVGNATDCDDTLASANPSNSEICDGVDNDCDGTADDGLPVSTYARDCDGDGFGEIGGAALVLCAPPGVPSDCGSGLWSTTPTDCDDALASANPSNSETCDDVDNDCDGTADDGLPVTTYARDCDGDGFGEIGGTALIRCSPPPSPADCGGGMWATNTTDCNDTLPSANPGNGESCDDVDNDCDGTIDEGIGGTSLRLPCYPDMDEDGRAPAGAMEIGVCTDVCPRFTTVLPPADEARTDCDDTNAAVAGLVDGRTDGDRDGVGGADARGCPTAAGFVPSRTGPTDCNDGNADIFPGQTRYFPTPTGRGCTDPNYPLVCGGDRCGRMVYRCAPCMWWPSCLIDGGADTIPQVDLWSWDCDPAPVAPPVGDACTGCGACNGGYVHTGTAQCGQNVDYNTCANGCHLTFRICARTGTESRPLPCR